MRQKRTKRTVKQHSKQDDPFIGKITEADPWTVRDHILTGYRIGFSTQQ